MCKINGVELIQFGKLFEVNYFPEIAIRTSSSVLGSFPLLLLLFNSSALNFLQQSADYNCIAPNDDRTLIKQH